MTPHWRRKLRQFYRWLSGDLAYEHYLKHWHAHHAAAGVQPLSRPDFFRERTIRRWRGINRCC